MVLDLEEEFGPEAPVVTSLRHKRAGYKCHAEKKSWVANDDENPSAGPARIKTKTRARKK
jgi:hypothetical protein